MTDTLNTAQASAEPDRETELVNALRRSDGRMHWSRARQILRMQAREFTPMVQAMVQAGRVRWDNGPGLGYLLLPELRAAEVASGVLDTSQVAERMQVTESTVRRWLRDGVIHGVKPSGNRMGSYRISQSELDRLMAQRP